MNVDWIKTAWEAIKSNMKTRFGLALGFTIFLCLYSVIENLPGGVKVYTWLATPAFLLAIIFWITVFLDVLQKVVEWLQGYRNSKKFEKYILSLSGRKLDIVKHIYKAEGNRLYLPQNDTDVIDLAMHNVIISLKHYTVVNSSFIDDINNPPFLYILQPRALDIIKVHESKFS